VAGCIISVRRTYSYIRALTYLLTYTVGSGVQSGNISDTVEDRAKAIVLTAYKVVHWLSIAAKMYDLE